MEEIVILNPNTEQYAIEQAKRIMELSSLKDAHVVLMPDCHPGHYAPIGFTATIEKDKLLKLQPAVIGNDIGCGVTVTAFKEPKRGINFDKLDNVIREFCIDPSDEELPEDVLGLLNDLKCKDRIGLSRQITKFGTLGGGNHFIEIERGGLCRSFHDDEYVLMVHSGSRYLGTQVFEYYQKIAYELENKEKAPIDCCLSGEALEDYIHDVIIVSRFAKLSRDAIISTICNKLKFKTAFMVGTHSTTHNMIDYNGYNEYTIRKGATHIPLMGVLPINPKEGSLYYQVAMTSITGVSNAAVKWNGSLPHGAGRILPRAEVANHYTLNHYKKAMVGIHSDTVSKDTLDECPMAYRSLDDIKDILDDIIEPIRILKPVYNFKNGG